MPRLVKPKSKSKGIPFSSLPLEYRPAAKAKLEELKARYISTHGHPPSQPRYALMIGHATAVTRNHVMKNPRWKTAMNRVMAKRRKANLATKARLAATSPEPVRHPEPRTYWSPLLIS